MAWRIRLESESARILPRSIQPAIMGVIQTRAPKATKARMRNGPGSVDGKMYPVRFLLLFVLSAESYLDIYFQRQARSRCVATENDNRSTPTQDSALLPFLQVTTGIPCAAEWYCLRCYVGPSCMPTDRLVLLRQYGHLGVDYGSSTQSTYVVDFGVDTHLFLSDGISNVRRQPGSPFTNYSERQNLISLR